MEKPNLRYYTNPLPLSRMLRIHCLQLFYNLSNPEMEDSLHKIESTCWFTRITIDTAPDETTSLTFRH
ncbi:transposase [Gynuella sp.]|uniref:transposase n=1 Tax=Gynuella sp. TaxID=2969146 RepID=UPI003D0E2F90